MNIIQKNFGLKRSVSMFTQNQRKNLQSSGKNKLSYLGGKVKVKN